MMRASIRYGGQLSQTSPGLRRVLTFGLAINPRYPWVSSRKRRSIPKIGANRAFVQRALRAQGRQHGALVEVEEAVLVGADLVDVDVVVAGVDVLADRLYVPVGVGAADDALGDRLLVDQFGPLFEVGGEGQLEEVAAADAAVRPPFQRRPPRLVFGLRPAD